MTHLLGITGATAFVILCTVLPFLPGRYDSLAMPLSMMAQLFGKVGLLLVPVGAIWAAFEYSSVHRRKRYAFAIAALIASCRAKPEPRDPQQCAIDLRHRAVSRRERPVSPVDRVGEQGLQAGGLGIAEYRYEPGGEAYNLFFEHTTFMLGTREIVMYNPRGEQVMTSHALDVLQLTPEQLALDRTRGHNAAHNATEPNWKYFWFD